MIHSKPDLYKGRIHPPHQHAVDLPATRCLQQFLTGLSLRGTGADFLDLHDDGPTPPRGVFPHGRGFAWGEPSGRE